VRRRARGELLARYEDGADMEMAYRERWEAEIAEMRRVLAGLAMKEECKWGKPTYTVATDRVCKCRHVLRVLRHLLGVGALLEIEIELLSRTVRRWALPRKIARAEDALVGHPQRTASPGASVNGERWPHAPVLARSDSEFVSRFAAADLVKSYPLPSSKRRAAPSDTLDKDARFAFRLTQAEMAMPTEIAGREERNPSDVVRRLIRREHAAITTKEAKPAGKRAKK
jgi:hypothetical protein